MIEYVIYIFSVFLMSFLEPFIFNIFGFSIFFIVINIALKKRNNYGILVIVLLASLALDTVFKYPLGVYLVSVLFAEIVELLFATFLSEDIFFQNLLKKFVSSLIFYLSLFFASTLSFTVFFSVTTLKALLLAVISSILLVLLSNVFRESKSKSGFLKFK